MKKILHVAEQAKGGVATILNELLDYSCAKKGYVSAVLTSEDHKSFIKHEHNIYSYKGERNLLGLIKLFFSIRRSVKDFKPDVIHLHSSFAGAIGRLALLFNNTKIIYHPHGVSFDPDRVSGGKLYILKSIERILSLFCTKIVAISNYEFACLEGVVKSEKLVLAVNGVRDIEINIKAARKESLLFIGRLDKQKGLEYLLDFYNKNQIKYDLHIVGESCISKNANYPQSCNVKYLGWVDYADVARLLASYKAVVIPSVWEGFGLVAIEALRSGTPILISDRGALPYILDKGDNIGSKFSLNDIHNTFHNAIEELDSFYDFEIHMRCKNTFLNFFQASDMCEKIFELYDSV